VWFQKISSPPPNERSLEIPRGRGGSKAETYEGSGEFMGSFYSRG